MMIIKGNLAANPALVYAGTELEAVVNGTVFSRLGRNMQGDYHEDVPVRFKAWGHQALFLSEHYSKGNSIYFAGEERLEVYLDKDGVERKVITCRIIAILHDETYKEIVSFIRRLCRAANEANFDIPGRVNLDAEPCEEPLPEEDSCVAQDVPEDTEALFESSLIF